MQLRQKIADPALGRQPGKREVGRGLGAAQSQLQGLPGGDPGIGPFPPEVKGRLNLLGIQLHPLAPHLDQGRFPLYQLLEFGQGKVLVAQGQLPVEAHDLVQVYSGAPGHFGGLDLGPGRQAHFSAPAAPPGGQHHPEAGLFQQQGLFGEKGKGAAGIQGVAVRQGGHEAGL